MVRAVMALALASVAASGCGGDVRSGEGVKCSNDPNESPQYVCSPAADLVCITTYSILVTNEKVAAQFDGGIRQVFVCRLACSTNDDCRQGGDICCPGQIVGKTYGKLAGCAPASACNTIDGAAPSSPREAGIEAPVSDGGVERPADAPVDAPSMDARPVDAVPVDAAIDAPVDAAPAVDANASVDAVPGDAAPGDAAAQSGG